jgi:hypothetical protein
MQTQKIRPPKYGQTPFYAENGWLRIEPVECVSIRDAIVEYNDEDRTWEIFNENHKNLATFSVFNKHLCIILPSDRDGGE